MSTLVMPGVTIWYGQTLFAANDVPKMEAARRSLESVLPELLDKHGLTRSVLISRQQDRDTVARRWAVYADLHALGFSTPAIGNACNRDHTSILHALKRVGVR